MRLGFKTTFANKRLVLLSDSDMDTDIIGTMFPECTQSMNGNITIPYSFATLVRIREALGSLPDVSKKASLHVHNLLAMESARVSLYDECLDVYDEFVQPYINSVRKGIRGESIPDMPPQMYPVFKPLDHQQVSLRYMYELLDIRTGHALFFEQGTGKTYTALMWAEYLIEQGMANKVLIVSPLFAMFNAWKDDIEKFTSLSHEILWNSSSSKKKYRLIREQISGDSDILLINKEGVSSFMKDLVVSGIDMIIVDESWIIKNHRAGISKSLRELGSLIEHKLILNGTPMPNSITDLWSQMLFIDNGMSLDMDFNQFRGDHMNEVNTHIWVPRPGSFEKVGKSIHPYTLKFKKKEVLDLPPRRHYLMMIPMGKVQRTHYDMLEKEGFTEFEGHEISYEYIITKGMRLRQIISGFDWGAKGEENANGQPPSRMPSTKYDALRELVDGISKEPYFKVIIWITFKQEADRIAEVLNKAKQRFVVANSSVPSKRIIKSIDMFKNSSDMNWLIAHPRSIGAGLNLQESNFTILFSLSEDYKDYSQLLDRNHRATSERPVTCYYIVAEDSYDAKIIKDLRKKGARQDMVVHGFKSSSLRARNLRDEWRIED